MASDPRRRSSTFEEYLSLLRNSNRRLAFDHGEISAMAGSSANHAAISFNICRALDDSPCRASVVDWVVRLQENLTVIPDVVVTCEQSDQDEAFFLESPRPVGDVLSKSPGGGIERTGCCSPRQRRRSTRLSCSLRVCNMSRSSLLYRPVGTAINTEQEKHAFSHIAPSPCRSPISLVDSLSPCSQGTRSRGR